MALIVHFAPKGMDQEKYAEVLRQLEAAGNGAPRGRLHHVCYGDRSALRVTDLFDTQQIIEICFTVGVSNMINRFHATFSTELDPIIRAAVGDACPLAYPEPPA